MSFLHAEFVSDDTIDAVVPIDEDDVAVEAVVVVVVAVVVLVLAVVVVVAVVVVGPTRASSLETFSPVVLEPFLEPGKTTTHIFTFACKRATSASAHVKAT